MIPPILQKLGNLVGFEANRENAIRLLNHTYLSGCPRAIESGKKKTKRNKRREEKNQNKTFNLILTGLLLMGIKHFLLDEEEEAKSIFQKICQAYPYVFGLLCSSFLSFSFLHVWSLFPSFLSDSS